MGKPVCRFFNVLHHELYNSGSSSMVTLSDAEITWRAHDGIPMVDYSSGENNGNHGESLDSIHCERFLVATQPYDFDILMEVKYKMESALKAVEIIKKDKQFFHG